MSYVVTNRRFVTNLKVLETMEAKSEHFSFLKSTDVWGRLEDPAGWIVLVDSGVGWKP